MVLVMQIANTKSAPFPIILIKQLFSIAHAVSINHKAAGAVEYLLPGVNRIAQAPRFELNALEHN
jgi:hypothetical protein